MVTTAIVIHSRPILEHDVLVELFSNDYGKMRVFAKYAQSKKPRFGGMFNTFNIINASIVVRGSAMHIQSAKLIHGFNHLKQSYQKMHMAYDFLKVVQSTAQMQQESQALFDALVESLNDIEKDATNESAIKQKFYRAVLHTEGVLDPASAPDQNLESMLESYANIRLKGAK